MLNKILEIDSDLFIWLNQFHNDFIDVVMHHVSGKFEWIPVYILLFYLVYRKTNWRTLLLFFGVVIACVGLGDFIGNTFFKKVFNRERPSYALEGIVHIVNDYKGSQFKSFISNHALNFFAWCSFTGLVLRKYYKYALPVLLGVATLVAYSRIYLGVHYPLDVTVGAAIGLTIGYSGYRLFTVLYHHWFGEAY